MSSNDDPQLAQLRAIRTALAAVALAVLAAGTIVADDSLAFPLLVGTLLLVVASFLQSSLR